VVQLVNQQQQQQQQHVSRVCMKLVDGSENQLLSKGVQKAMMR